MKTLTLTRFQQANDLTFGTLQNGEEFICYTLELPWKDNKKAISCIPEGEYLVDHLLVSASGKYVDIYKINNVKGRTGILIHKGNYPKDTRGCILVGTEVEPMARAIKNSRVGLEHLHFCTNRQSFKLIVRS